MDFPVFIMVIFASSFVASFIQRVSGFGFGIFMMTILPLVMPSYGEATALSGLLALVNSMYICIRMWKQIPWKKLLPILITFIVVSFFAIRWVAGMDGRVLKHILGGILIFVSIYFFFISERIRVKPTMGVQLATAALTALPGSGSCERSRLLGERIDYTWRYLLEKGDCPWGFTISVAIPAIFAACMARSSFSSFCLLR